MSQILTLELDLQLEELQRELQARGVVPQSRPGRRLMLPASGECIPEPVDLLCPAGSADTLEAWGFRVSQGKLSLVCGEFDRQVLLEGLVDPIRKSIATQRVKKALQELQDQEALERAELTLQPDPLVQVLPED